MTRFHADDSGPLRTDTRALVGLANVGLGLFILLDLAIGMTPYAGQHTTATSAGVAFGAVLLGAWAVRDALEPRTPDGEEIRGQVPRPDRWARESGGRVREAVPDVRAWFGRGKR